MDYNQAYGRERLTGRGYFTPTGLKEVDLGDIEMFSIDFGIKRKQAYRARHGSVVLFRDDAYGAESKWTLTIDESTTPTLPFAWAGTANAPVMQAAATAATFAFSSQKGNTFAVGKYGLGNASLTTPAAKVEGDEADYVISRSSGRIYIPEVSTIANVTACILTYDCPAITYDSINALTVLNRPGTIELHGEDDSQSGKLTADTDAEPPPRLVWSGPCILSADKSGDFKYDDYRKWTLVLTMTGQLVSNRLQS